MTRSSRLLVVIGVCLALPSFATAALKDVGPVDPVTGFPVWYRDTNGKALGLCLEMRPSPNATSGGAPMCFPIVPNPDGFPGNLGDENFYHQMSNIITGANGFGLAWEAALEAAYASGAPVRGQEITFARIRIRADITTPGTYTVTHPYGVLVFPNVPAGVKAINFTDDIGVGAGVFTGALAGAMGPFLEWDQVLVNGVPDVNAPFGNDPLSGVPFQLALTNPDGSQVQFVGDPSVLHSVKGSPFGSNTVRVDGPPGSNLDGLGNDFIVSDLFAILGQRYTLPIALPLAAARSNVSVNAQTGVASVDTFARSVPGAQLIATAPGVPTMALTTDAISGEAAAHVEFSARDANGALIAFPSAMTLTNITDNPHSSVTGTLADFVSPTTQALYDPVSGALTLTVQTSVQLNAPAINIVELPGVLPTSDAATPWIQSFSATVALAQLPWQLTAQSAMGGSHVEQVTFLQTAGPAAAGPSATNFPDSCPPAGPCTTAEGTPLVISDATWSAAGLSLLVLNPPVNGTAVAAVDLNGIVTITYTPKNLFSGPDSFTYVLRDATTLAYSNVGTVSVDVTAVNNAPVAVADFASTSAGTPVLINLTANDTDVDSAIVPASVVIGPVTGGFAQSNGNGTATFTPLAGFTGNATFTYTITDAGGVTSAPGTVTVTVTGQTETLTIIRADWVVNKGRYRIDGTSSVFGPGLANTVTVRAGTLATGAVIGTATVSAAGAWTIDVVSPVVLDATNRATATSTGGGSIQFTVRRR